MGTVDFAKNLHDRKLPETESNQVTFVSLTTGETLSALMINFLFFSKSKEIWRYSNIKCCTYPLRGIDTIADGGHIGLFCFLFLKIFSYSNMVDWNSSLMSIVSGKTEDHLTMLDNMVIERLLNDKWSSFARVTCVSIEKKTTISESLVF